MKCPIKFVEMLYNSNLIAIVGKDPNSLFPPNKAILWDLYSEEKYTEFSFEENVVAIKIRFDLSLKSA